MYTYVYMYWLIASCFFWPSRICRVSGFLARSSRSWPIPWTTHLAMVMTGGWFKWHCFSHISSNHFKYLYLFMVYHGLSHVTFFSSPNRYAYHHGLSWFIMLYPSRSKSKWPPAAVESTVSYGFIQWLPKAKVMISEIDPSRWCCHVPYYLILGLWGKLHHLPEKYIRNNN